MRSKLKIWNALFFFHRCLENILEYCLNMKKAGLRGVQTACCHLILFFFLNKNAIFTNYPDYCYSSFKALQTVLKFWDYLKKQKKLQPPKVRLFLHFLANFSKHWGRTILGTLRGSIKNVFSRLDLYDPYLQHTKLK